jgi:hypothetical protein
MKLFARRERPPLDPVAQANLAAASALVDELHSMPLDRLMNLGGPFLDVWPEGGGRKGLPSERTASQLRPVADRLSCDAFEAVNGKCYEAEPGLENFHYTYVQYGAPMKAAADAVFALASRDLLDPADYAKLTEPWRRTFGPPER